MKTSLFSWRIFVRSALIIFIAAMFIATINNSVVISKGNEKIQTTQLKTLTNLLTSQAAMSASKLISQDDQDGLFELANQIAEEKLVYNTSIYDVQGRLLASSSDESVRETIGLDTPLGTARLGRQQLVSPIFNDKAHQVGFVRITFERGQVTAVSDHYYRNSDHLMYLMILMSFAAGVGLTILLTRRTKQDTENILLKEMQDS